MDAEELVPLFPPHRAPATPGPEPGPHGGFQKDVSQSLASLLNHGPADRPIEVRVQDEARIGQKNGRVRIRARKGTRPAVPQFSLADAPHPGAQGDETAMAGRSTKLNRVEKVWQSLRENGLSNRFFEDHANGLAAGCDAWTRLMKEPTAIKSGASREWTQNRQT